MASYSFLITEGPDEGRVYQLKPGITMVGRRDCADDNDPVGSHRFVLTDPAVSRTHARIDWDGEKQPLLIHLSSTNATLLEGKVVAAQSIEDAQPLGNGNVLRMGQTGMEVQEIEKGTRWNLRDLSSPERSHPLPVGESLLLESVCFDCVGAVVKAHLSTSNGEAYLLRSLDGQIWTTPLRVDSPVVLKDRDILRTENQKLIVHDREVGQAIESV